MVRPLGRQWELVEQRAGKREHLAVAESRTRVYCSRDHGGGSLESSFVRAETSLEIFSRVNNATTVCHAVH